MNHIPKIYRSPLKSTTFSELPPFSSKSALSTTNFVPEYQRLTLSNYKKNMVCTRLLIKTPRNADAAAELNSSSKSTVVIFNYLLSNNSAGYCNDYRVQLAKATGYSERTITRAFKKLVYLGLITKQLHLYLINEEDWRYGPCKIGIKRALNAFKRLKQIFPKSFMDLKIIALKMNLVAIVETIGHISFKKRKKAIKLILVGDSVHEYIEDPNGWKDLEYNTYDTGLSPP